MLGDFLGGWKRKSKGTREQGSVGKNKIGRGRHTLGTLSVLECGQVLCVCAREVGTVGTVGNFWDHSSQMLDPSGEPPPPANPTPNTPPRTLNHARTLSNV